MADWEDLHRKLWAEVQRQEGKIVRNTAQFMDGFLEQLRRDGYALTPDTETALRAYLDDAVASVRAAVTAAILPTAQTVMAGASLAAIDAVVTQAAAEAFSRRWPDGMNLSERLWKWEDGTRRAVSDALRQGIESATSSNKLIYDLQYLIERQAGGQFAIVTEDLSDWVKGLEAWSRAAADSPDARKFWRTRVLPQIEKHIDTLKDVGTRRAAERLLRQVKDAVEAGRQDLIDKSLQHWVYDRQLYDLKRAVRTEMSTAQHRAVITTTQMDPDIIGYQWRLSGSHPRPDICDFYANLDFGLGRGVFPKSQVPQGKAHPHCLCLIVPRVSRERRKGSAHYGEFIRDTTDDIRNQILPTWAKGLYQAGFPIEKLVRPDGMGLVSLERGMEIVRAENWVKERRS